MRWPRSGWDSYQSTLRAVIHPIINEDGPEKQTRHLLIDCQSEPRTLFMLKPQTEGSIQCLSQLHRTTQLTQELFATLQLCDRDELIRLVRLDDIARAAYDGRDTDALEQACLGRIGHLAFFVVLRQSAHQRRDGFLLRCFQRRAGSDDADVDF